MFLKPRILAFVLFFSLGLSPTYAAILLDSSESQPSPEQEQEQAEFFPLTQAPPEVFRTDAPNLQSEDEWHSLRAKILSDFASRISAQFQIAEGLRERAEFWFDIYARYGEAHHIIHHALYPWIIYKTLDTTEILVHGKGPQWLRHDRANKLAQSQVVEVRRALRSLSRRKDYTVLSPLERDLFNKLMPVKGPRQYVFQMAALNVRSQLGQKDFFQRGLVNSSRYLTYMEQEFQHLDLPVELTRMPFVESSFNEEARSKVGASGIWQIMPSTGKAYMIVNTQIDERNSPLKATVIAGRLLHSYNHALASWPLAITSYNYGIGNIQKAIRHAHSRDLVKIIQRYHQGDFKFASSNFYTCFLAALFAEKYNELIFKEIPREPILQQEALKLVGPTKLTYLKRVIGLDTKELLKYNLDLKSILGKSGSLPRGYKLYLPPGYKDRLMGRKLADLIVVSGREAPEF